MVRQLGGKRRFKYLNKEKLKSLILQKQILEYLLTDNFHFDKRIQPKCYASYFK